MISWGKVDNDAVGQVGTTCHSQWNANRACNTWNANRAGKKKRMGRMKRATRERMKRAICHRDMSMSP